jgi:predicted dehydrogenase
MFTFENGCIVTLEANWYLPSTTPYLTDSKMEIHGTEGILYIDLADQGLKVNDRNGWRFPDISWWPEKMGTTWGALREEIAYLADCVMLGKQPEDGLGDPKRAKYALEIVLAAERSAETGEVVKL